MSNSMLVSVEVINLLKWIIKNGKDDLHGLINKAISDGCLDIDEDSRFDSTKNLADFQLVSQQYLALFEQNINESVDVSLDLDPAVTALMLKLSTSTLDPLLIVNCIRAATVDLKNKIKGGVDTPPSDDEILQMLLNNILQKWNPTQEEAQA